MRLLFSLLVGFMLVSCQQEGCTDPNAINYSPNADVDDGSCQYGTTNPPPTGGANIDSTLIIGTWHLIDMVDANQQPVSINPEVYYEFNQPMQFQSIDWINYSNESWGQNTIESGTCNCTSTHLTLYNSVGSFYEEYELIELSQQNLIMKNTLTSNTSYLTRI